MLSKAKLVNELRQEDSRTYNGALTNSTSLNSVLDLFFLSGACRNESEKNIKSAIERAIVEDKELAIRCILWAGDIRGGAGERRFFKIALGHLYTKYNDIFKTIYKKVPFYSRWDVLFNYRDDYILEFIKEALDTGDSLLAKWLPRKKQYNNFSSIFRKKFKISPKTYRERIVELSKIVETNLCKKQYDFDYSQVPSVAFKKYNKAFRRNDEKRFEEFLNRVEKGEAKINAKAIFPYDLFRSYKSGGDTKAIDQQWNCLPDYIGDSGCKFMPVCDVSGSMTGLPMEISVSLGCYLSERNKSVFKDAFITFSGNPEMQYLKGNITSRFQQLRTAKWELNTNIQAVFDLILNKAIQGKLSQDDMPTHILIISDMEFDVAEEGKTNFNTIKDKYKSAEFVMPNIVFWNVNGRTGNVPVSYNEKGVALVSGASPQIVKNLLCGDLDPIKVMLKALNVERYDLTKQ